MIDLRLLGDGIIYVGAIAVALTAIGVFLRMILVRPFMNKLREELITPLLSKLDDIDKRLTDHLKNHS